MKNKRHTILIIIACLSAMFFLMAGCGTAGTDLVKENRKEMREEEKTLPADNNPAEKTESIDSSVEEEEEKDGQTADESFHLLSKVVYMNVGDRLDLLMGLLGDDWKDKQPGGGLSWTSSQPEVAGFESDGALYAASQGNAVINCSKDGREEKVCVNVFDGFGSGSWWDMDVRSGPDLVRTYRNYDQGAYEYGDCSQYVAMHGCALCCTATVVRAWYPEEDWSPEKVWAELEPEAEPEAYDRNYSKSMSKQMPLTLKGISRILTLKDIPHHYVTEFDKAELTDDLAENLRQGYMIVYEAGRGGYHMMMMLGVMTDGSFIISDSVGYDRVRTVSAETLSEQMFSCKKEPKSSYFSGRKTAGGYIVVGKEEK